MSSFQDSSAGKFSEIAGDFFRLPPFIYIQGNKKDHRVLAIKEFQDQDYEDLLKRPVFCPSQGHQKEELKLLDHVSYGGPRPIRWSPYRPLYRSTLDRCLDRVSIETRSSIGGCLDRHTTDITLNYHLRVDR